eukprot:c3879_g1_i1.p1 GENE.c3879_g1_i1~~c3879_g1_i1.p1  ORF type:complete len:119 (+),score=41.71 c3879_g1_i1:29-358(+)
MTQRVPQKDDIKEGAILGWIVDYACKYDNKLIFKALSSDPRIAETNPDIGRRQRFQQIVYDLDEIDTTEPDSEEWNLIISDISSIIQEMNDNNNFDIEVETQQKREKIN